MRNLFRYISLFLFALPSLYVTSAAAQLTIGNYSLVNVERVTRTDFNYTYRAETTNSGPDDLAGVSALLTSRSPNTIVVEGELIIGNVPAGSTISSTDTFTIRQNRNFPFDPSVLIWDIQGGPSVTEINVRGRVLFDTGEPVAGAQVFGSVDTPESAVALRALEQSKPLHWSDPEFKKNPVSQKSKARLSLQSTDRVSTRTDANGDFTIKVKSSALPVKVLAEIRFQSGSLPVVQSGRWKTAENEVLDIGTITIPNPQGAELAVTNGAAQNADGSIRIEGLPASVKRLFARAYDPGVSPEAFPGEFAELGRIPLNSSVFLWMAALDANGNEVTEFPQVATIRTQIPRSQWTDLEDINPGTDRIEIPIYNYNEGTNLWEQQGAGWLEAPDGTVLPEDAQSVVLDRTFSDFFDSILAAVPATSSTWKNVDYAFIGPWKLSRLDPSKRNNECFFNALQLANAIVKSGAGRAAFAKVNKEGADLNTELADGRGPAVRNADLTGYAGVYDIKKPDEFMIRNSIWDHCGLGATVEAKKNTTLYMAATMLHETAHWKDDNKKFPADDTSTPGEEGDELEKDLFGGLVTNGRGIWLNGKPISNGLRDLWLNPAYWLPFPIRVPTIQAEQQSSSLELTISLPKDTFESGEEIPVQVTYKNISGSPIEVMNRVVLEGWPLYFNIIKQGTEKRVPFIGLYPKLDLEESDFTTLQPDQTLNSTVNLLRDPTTGRPQYKLISSGTYELTAVYEEFYRGVPESTSNTLTFSVKPAGSISGTITNATNGQPLSGAIIEVFQNNNFLTEAKADASGKYIIPEVPAGVFTLEAHASGFLHSTQENVDVVVGANTPLNFNLSELLARDALRLVLSWGGQPRDLDSHLWLPLESPYHVFFQRQGNLSTCPSAILDVDDIDGFGPEAITISQRFGRGTYLYAIHNFSGESDLSTSQARVQVFDSTGLIRTINVPAAGSGRFWKVLTIDAQTGRINVINELGDNPEPYPDTAAGCPPG